MISWLRNDITAVSLVPLSKTMLSKMRGALFFHILENKIQCFFKVFKAFKIEISVFVIKTLCVSRICYSLVVFLAVRIFNTSSNQAIVKEVVTDDVRGRHPKQVVLVSAKGDMFLQPRQGVTYRIQTERGRSLQAPSIHEKQHLLWRHSTKVFFCTM